MKRVLIIGAGGIGKRHIRGFLKTNRAKVSICLAAKESYRTLRVIELNRRD